MIRAYSIDLPITANENIPFKVNKILTGRTISHEAGSGDIIINTPGYYMVNISLSGKTSASGKLVLELYAEDKPIIDAISTVDVDSDTNFTQTINTIVKATPGNISKNIKLNVRLNTAVLVNNVSIGLNRLA